MVKLLDILSFFLFCYFFEVLLFSRVTCNRNFDDFNLSSLSGCD